MPVDASPSPRQRITIREAFPHLTDDQVEEAEHAVARYVALVYRIYCRIAEDPEAYAQLQRRLTADSVDDSMKGGTDDQTVTARPSPHS